MMAAGSRLGKDWTRDLLWDRMKWGSGKVGLRVWTRGDPLSRQMDRRRTEELSMTARNSVSKMDSM